MENRAAQSPVSWGRRSPCAEKTTIERTSLRSDHSPQLGHTHATASDSDRIRPGVLGCVCASPGHRRTLMTDHERPTKRQKTNHNPGAAPPPFTESLLH